MEDNKKRDYDDFFRQSGDNSSQEYTNNKQERPSYYYAYGPYKSANDDGSNRDLSVRASSASSESVDVSAPRPVRPYPYTHTANRSTSKPNNWKLHEPRKRTSFMSIFAAFMAGALVIGSLMFVSDWFNLFSGGSTAAPVAISSDQSSTGNGSDSLQSSSGNLSASYEIVRPGSISAIVQQSSPAVVKVESYVTTSQSSNSSLYNDPFYRYFFGDRLQQQEQDSSRRVLAGMGTGFIFEESGYIITNQHVIEGAEEITVTVEGYDEPFTAELLGNSFDLDLAVLKITGESPFATLPIGDSGSMQIGDWVVAIGNPYGFEHTVTVGVLSAKEREISISESSGTRNYQHLLQTDASINPGNSGGPLLNLNGEVIGINTAISSQAQGIGFAIPTSTIVQVIDNLMNNEEIPRQPSPYLGVQLSNLSNLDESYLRELNITDTDGAIISQVILGQPAFRAGLKVYDIVISVDGQPVRNANELVEFIQSKNAGDVVTFDIIRDGENISIDVPIGNRYDYE